MNELFDRLLTDNKIKGSIPDSIDNLTELVWL